MALWVDAKLLFSIFFITCCCTVTEAQMAMDCCLSVKNKTIDCHSVADYIQQIAGQGCSLDAMILVTRRNRKLCVPAGELWVQEVVKHVDFVKKRCKKTNYRGQRCHGVRRE